MPLSPILRAVRANLKLGWDIEGNWAPAWAYLFIALATPAAGVLMLVFIYLVVMGAAGEKVFLAYLMGGASVFVFVRLVLSAAGWAVIEDREHYKTLRYIYIAPSPFAAVPPGRDSVAGLYRRVHRRAGRDGRDGVAACERDAAG